MKNQMMASLLVAGTMTLAACATHAQPQVMETGGVAKETAKAKDLPPKEGAETKKAEPKKGKAKAEPKLKPAFARKADLPEKVEQVLNKLDPNSRTKMTTIITAKGQSRNVHVRSLMTELAKTELAPEDKKILLGYMGMEILVSKPGDTSLIEEGEWVALNNTKDEPDKYGLFMIVKQYESPINRVDLAAKIGYTKEGKPFIKEMKNAELQMWYKQSITTAYPDRLPYIGVVIYNKASGGKGVALVYGLTQKQAAFWATGVYAGMNFLYSKKAGSVTNRPTATEWDPRIGPGTGKKIQTVEGDPPFIPMVFRVSASLPNWVMLTRKGKQKGAGYCLILQCKDKAERARWYNLIKSKGLEISHSQ